MTCWASGCTWSSLSNSLFSLFSDKSSTWNIVNLIDRALNSIIFYIQKKYSLVPQADSLHPLQLPWVVSNDYNRDWIGVDLNVEYIFISSDWIVQFTLPKIKQVLPRSTRCSSTSWSSGISSSSDCKLIISAISGTNCCWGSIICSSKIGAAANSNKRLASRFIALSRRASPGKEILLEYFCYLEYHNDNVLKYHNDEVLNLPAALTGRLGFSSPLGSWGCTTTASA